MAGLLRRFSSSFFPRHSFQFDRYWNTSHRWKLMTSLNLIKIKDMSKANGKIWIKCLYLGMNEASTGRDHQLGQSSCCLRLWLMPMPYTHNPPVSCCCFSMRDFLLTLTSFINIELFLVLAHVVDGCHQAKKTLFIAISALMGICVWLSIIGLAFHIYFFRLWYTRRIAFDCCWSFIWSQNSTFQIDDIITCCVLAFEAKGCTLDLWQTIGDGLV